MKNKIARSISGRIAGILSVLFCYTFTAGCGSKGAVYLESSEARENSVDFAGQADTQAPVQADLCVYVCGAVRSPGVYYVAAGSRVGDAVDTAGGMTEDAGKEYWNLAEYVTDGQRIDIPTEAEVLAERAKGQNDEGNSQEENRSSGGKAPAAAGGTAPDGRVDINMASREELQQIPGIGETRADAIIRYREANGGFSRIEDIMNVTGIKEGLFTKMQEYITVTGNE